MDEEKRELEDYVFSNKRDFVKATKEKEVVDHMKATVHWKNPTVAYKLYNRILDKNSFTTIIGIDFLKELREIIVTSGVSTKEGLRPIPVKKQEVKVDEYQERYENALVTRRIERIAIGFLSLIIVGMLVVAYFTPYNVFSNYEEKIRNEYSEWEQQLNEREAALKELEEN
jgi:hypothetical protein